MFIREDITYVCNLYRKVMLSTMILITVFISDHEANSYCHEICLKFGNTLGKKNVVISSCMDTQEVGKGLQRCSLTSSNSSKIVLICTV